MRRLDYPSPPRDKRVAAASREQAMRALLDAIEGETRTKERMADRELIVRTKTAAHGGADVALLDVNDSGAGRNVTR